jgi:hypothetical protein
MKAKQALQTLLFTLATSPLVLAATKGSQHQLAKKGDSLQNILVSWGPTIITFFFVAGLVCFGLILFDLYKMSKPQGQKPEVMSLVYKFVAGVVGVGLAGVAKMGRDSILDENEKNLSYKDSVKDVF